MGERVMTVSEARRLLPRLLSEVSAGRGPVLIGPRGVVRAVLVHPDEYERLRTLAASGVAESSGWSDLRLEIVGSPEDLERAMADLREERQRRFQSAPPERARGTRKRVSARKPRKASTR